MPLATLTSWLASEPLTTTLPLAQMLLGAIGLASMISYAIRREALTRTFNWRLKRRSALLLARSLRQGLGGHHHVAAHARIRGK